MMIPLQRGVITMASTLIALGAAVAGCAAPAPVELAWQRVGGSDGLRCPTGLAVDPHGALTVVDAGHDRLVRLSAAGQPSGSPSQSASRPGEFRFALPPDPDVTEECLVGGGVAVAADGSTVVADLARIQRFDRDGRLVAAWADAGPDGRLALPAGIGVDDRTGHVYVVDNGAARVHKFDRDGRWLLGWGSRGWGPGEFASPTAVAVDGRGRVYVADSANHRVQQFDGDGRFLTAWGGYGTEAGEFLAPRGVAVDRAGRVYVVDAHRVQVFTDAGASLAVWPIGGGSLAVPGGIAVDDRGLVYVTDWGRGLILRYRPRGAGAGPGPTTLASPTATASASAGLAAASAPAPPPPLPSMTPTDR